MPIVHALSFVNVSNQMQLAAVDKVATADIEPGDVRIFVAREADIDWLSAAIETHLSMPQGDETASA